MVLSRSLKTSGLVGLIQALVLYWPIASLAAEFGTERIEHKDRGEQVIKARCLLREHGFVPVQEKDPHYYDHHLVDTAQAHQGSVGLPQPGNIGLGTLASFKRNAKAWLRCTGRDQLISSPTVFLALSRSPSHALPGASEQTLLHYYREWPSAVRMSPRPPQK
ncbi:hypothetical protein [Hoeflea sp.]|uniref:hypothetical protein n=1 Tax=Hoeflea sp. TaxID=1940281 RepID=UPI003748931C